MNKKMCLISSSILTITVFIFFICQCISIFITNELLAWISYGVCILLSWSYIITVIGHSYLCSEDRKISIEAGKLLAVVYSVFVCIVYFSQLTVVRQNVLGADIINAFTFDYPGSWMFGLDIIGYGIMALSTFFVGLSINPQTKTEKFLRNNLLIHGLFVVAMFMPMTSLFLGETSSSGLSMGALALAIWCIIFIPIGICSFLRFKNSKNL